MRIFRKSTSLRKQRPTSVLIYAPLDPEISGGVAQYVEGLVAGLVEIDTSAFAFTWVLQRGCSDWISPNLPDSHEVFEVDAPTGFIARQPEIASMFDLVHFPYQVGFRTSIPSIYQPHDLQHEHLPEFFSPAELDARRIAYPFLIEQASRIIVGAGFTARDISENYGTQPTKIDVIPFGIPHSPVGKRFETALRSPYLLYPAAAWPHKNHENLFRAVQLLRDQNGIAVPLILPGSTSGAVDLFSMAEDLGISDLVTMPGFISDDQLLELYRGARLVAVPSRFENASFPIWEAMRAGVPVVAASVTSLPKQVGDAGLLFDPEDPQSIATSIRQVWEDESLRAELVQRGRTRIQGLSWKSTAKGVLRSYRLSLDLALTNDDIRWYEEKYDL